MGGNNVPWHARTCCNVRRVGGLGWWGAIAFLGTRVHVAMLDVWGGLGWGGNNVPPHAHTCCNVGGVGGLGWRGQ